MSPIDTDPFAEPTEENTAPDAPVTDAEVLSAPVNDAPTHDTEHDEGLSDADARVPGDAAPIAAGAVTVDAPKEPLGSLPDTAQTTDTLPAIDTNLSDDNAPAGLTDAVIPTKPGGADLQDVLDDQTKNFISQAPKRPSEGLLNEIDLAWSELKHKVSMVRGDVGGEVGEVIAFVRSKL